MKHALPPLPYKVDALEPHVSAETLEYHYSKHHRGYVHKLNELIAGTCDEQSTLEELVIRAPQGPLYNAAAQAWNHDFYWHSLSPDSSGTPNPAIGKLIQRSFGSLDEFKQMFEKLSLELFGSGWVWLVRNTDGSLGIRALGNAGNPLREGLQPLLTCDLWEHAYYIDYRNQRARYLKAFWELVNWDFVSDNYALETRFLQPPRQRTARTAHQPGCRAPTAT